MNVRSKLTIDRYELQKVNSVPWSSVQKVLKAAKRAVRSFEAWRAGNLFLEKQQRVSDKAFDNWL